MSETDGSSATDSPVHQLKVHGSPSPAHKHGHASIHIGHIETSGKMDANLMDEKRKEHVAYEYLCHLEEAKKWIEACIEDELPSTTELEQALRNGVILCRLGHYYAPDIIPLRRIYDLDEAKYRAKGLHFKHTDNFNYWLRSLSHMGLPKIFYPITTDLYDRKNMPRVIYCIHALSLYLHKLGKAPQIEDLLGTATFTEEEISAMKKELDKYGIQMPSFGKIGGILANEMSVDEAAMHAAIMAVNEALDKESSAETLAALRNPNTCLVKVEGDNAERYHGILIKAKRDKASKAQNGTVEDAERDVYDYMLTQAEIQGGVNDVNAAVNREIAEAKLREVVSAVNEAISSGSRTSLLRALQMEGGKFKDVKPENMQWYMDFLSKAVSDKAESEESGVLSHSEVQDIINIANEVAEHTRLVEAAVLHVNEVLEEGDPDKTLEALQSGALDLRDVFPENKAYYHEGLLARKQRKVHEGEGGGGLTEEEIQAVVREMNERATHDRNVASAISEINKCISGDAEPEAVVAALSNEFAQLSSIDSTCGARYHVALRQAREEKGEGGEDLSQEEIRIVVERVNEEVRLERLAADAVCGVNSVLGAEGSSPAELLESLADEHMGVVNIQEAQALQYLNLLKAMKATKAERTSDPDAQLTKEEIQSAIDKANAQTVEAVEFAQAICSINESISSGDAAATLSSLKSAPVGIRSITDDCAATYQEKLAEAKQQKAESVGESSGWSEYRTKDGYSYYHNFTTGESQWERPESYDGQSPQLSKDEIQAVVTKVTADYDRWTLMEANEPLIVQLQAHWRGGLVRRPFQKRLAYLRDHKDQAVTLQAHWKGYRQRKEYSERLEFLKKQAIIAVKIQAMARMWKARKAYRGRLQFFGDHEAEVVKIQSFWRAKKAKKDYTQLVQVDQPPASSVRKFLALLEQSDIDFSEEIECQRLKAKVVQQIRSNQQLEQDLDVMDIKIGLLVKNRLTLQDLISHSQQVRRKDRKANRHSQLLEGGAVAAAVGGLTKANHEKVETYQHLFYLLQTHPTYFAKLIFEMPQSRTNRFLENVVLTVFNYAQNNREQYLLIKLFDTALQEEIESKVDKIMDIVTGNPTVIKMVIHYTRGERGQNVLRELIGPVVKEVLEKKDLVLLTSPVDVYRAWINQMETQTGEASKLPYDVSNDQALEHEEVRQKVHSTINVLQELADRFQQAFLDSVDKIPYAMRYIAMQLRLLLHRKFPEAPEDDILKVIGNLLYYRYMNPAIVAPDAFDIVDVSVEQQLTAEQRRNLGSIAKILQHASACKLFEAENAALSSMNPYLQEAFGRFREFFLRASTVDPPGKKLGIDEYSEVTRLTKPVIYISVKEICSTHSLLIDHEEAVAPDPSDPLHEILKELGPSPSVESLLGGVREAGPGEDKQDIINEAGKQEIALTLTNKYESLAKDDSTDMKALFVRTKRMVVDVLRVQHGENLTEVLYTPATPEQEEEHQEWVKRKEKTDQKQIQRSATIKRSDSMQGDRNLPLEGMKRKIMRNLRTLEEEGMVNSKNDYQEIINAIAKDIRNQHRYRQQRKQELGRLQETLDKLNSKAQFYEEQMKFYQQYVASCLDQLAKASASGKGKGRVRGPGQDAAGFKRQSVKYTAQKLFEKGVILEIEGLPKHQFRNVVFEITATDVGIFEVTGRFLGRQIEKVELVFQDLLQLQYEGLAIMKMFERAKINVNLLVYLINKKFHGGVQ